MLLLWSSFICPFLGSPLNGLVSDATCVAPTPRFEANKAILGYLKEKQEIGLGWVGLLTGILLGGANLTNSLDRVQH